MADDGWIKASERPATKAGNVSSRKVIFYDAKEGIEYGGWYDKRFGWLFSDGTEARHVTHWREMLKPPGRE